jgi:hypothetical protein
MPKLDFTAKPESFDYSAEAELFSARLRNSRQQALAYKRFARAADAIRFAIEALSPQLLVGTYLEVDEVRFKGTDIRSLYDSADYPFARAAAGPPR